MEQVYEVPVLQELGKYKLFLSLCVWTSKWKVWDVKFTPKSPG
jgi:hypothetical protein